MEHLNKVLMPFISYGANNEGVQIWIVQGLHIYIYSPPPWLSSYIWGSKVESKSSDLDPLGILSCYIPSTHTPTYRSWSNPVRALVIWHTSNLNFSTCLLLLYQSPSRILHVPHTNHWCLPVVNSLCDSVWATLLCCVTLLCEARLTQVDPDQNPALGYHSVGRWWRSKIIFSSSSVFQFIFSCPGSSTYAYPWWVGATLEFGHKGWLLRHETLQTWSEWFLMKTLPQAKRHKPSLLITSFTIFTSQTFITR